MNFKRVDVSLPGVLISLAVLAVGAGWILIMDLPFPVKLPALFSLVIWAFLAHEKEAFIPLAVAGMIAALQGWGGVPGITENPMVMWGIVLGQAACLVRMVFGGPWSAMLVGGLWSLMGIYVPGLVPLAVTGLFYLAFLQPNHGRKVVFPGLFVLIGALLYGLLLDRVPEEISRPGQVETYTEIAAAFLELFSRVSLWVVLPLVGLFEFGQSNPQQPKRGYRHFPLIGALLSIALVPPELLLGILYFVGLPAMSFLLTRWILALPLVRDYLDRALSPPEHPVPDNVWHTLLTLLLASALIWLAWTHGLSQFEDGEALTRTEQALFDGDPAHPLYGALEAAVDPTRFPAGFWNRWLSGVGLVFSLAILFRFLHRSIGVQAALGAVILLVTAPGVPLYFATAGSGVWAVFFFFLGMKALMGDEDDWSWFRGGLWVGAGICLQPIWFWPALGLMAGTFELYRGRLPKALIGLGLALGLGFVALLVADSAWVLGMLGGMFRADASVQEGGLWRLFLQQAPVLLVTSVLVLIFGATRRGLGWWCFVFSLPVALTANILFAEPAPALVPYMIFAVIGFVRLPPLMDIRHAGVYQPVLITQLLLWLPVHLGAVALGFFLF